MVHRDRYWEQAEEKRIEAVEQASDHVFDLRALLCSPHPSTITVECVAGIKQ